MPVTFDYAFWCDNAHKSGEQIAREYGLDAGNVRREMRTARSIYYDLDWRHDPRHKERQECPSEAVCAPVSLDSDYQVLTPMRHPRGSNRTDGTRGIAVFDLHYPQHDQRLWSNILRFVEDFRPDVFAWGGDNLDMEPVSHWLKNRRGTLEGKRLKQDYLGFCRHILAPLEARLPVECRRIWHDGNHEDWVDQYIDEHPEAQGFLEVEHNLPLEGWEYYDYGMVSRVGKLHIMHGEYTLLHNAYKTVDVYERNIIYGHGHTYQAHTKTTPLDGESHTAVQIPCACKLNPHYRLHKPNAWLNGFAVFHVRPNGDFNLYPVIAVDGCFTAPNGTYYGG
jgi:hypothetical protein